MVVFLVSPMKMKKMKVQNLFQLITFVALYFNIDHHWSMLIIIGQCWSSLVNVDHHWSMMINDHQTPMNLS